jgi:hypothetical protein
MVQVLQKAQRITLPADELAGMYGRQVAWKEKILQRRERAKQVQQEAEEAACTFHPNTVRAPPSRTPCMTAMAMLHCGVCVLIAVASTKSSAHYSSESAVNI